MYPDAAYIIRQDNSFIIRRWVPLISGPRRHGTMASLEDTARRVEASARLASGQATAWPGEDTARPVQWRREHRRGRPQRSRGWPRRGGFLCYDVTEKLLENCFPSFLARALMNKESSPRSRIFRLLYKVSLMNKRSCPRAFVE